MSKNRTYFIWIIITALLLTAMVYLYYEKRVEALEEKTKTQPP